MRRKAFILGPVGVLFLLAGGVSFALAPQYANLYPALLIAGGFFLLIYAVLFRDRLLEWGSRRGVRYGAGSAVSVILVLGILTFVALLTVRHNARFDMTAEGRYSLAPQTLKVLAGLNADVMVTAYYQTEGPGYAEAKDLLEQYAQASRRFTFEMVDPDRSPGRARAAGVNRYETLTVESAGHTEKITTLSEEKVTNAVIRVTRAEKKKLYFLTGHGERDLGDEGKNGFSMVREGLAGFGYDVAPLALMQDNAVPADAAALVVAGPQKDPLPAEREAIDAYIRGGGRVLFLLDPRQAPELAASMTQFGVVVGDDVIVDKMSRMFGADYLMPLVMQYPHHEITKDFTLASFFPLARSVTPDKPLPPGVTVDVLASTGDQSWAETDMAALDKGEGNMDPARDRPGPISLAVAGTVSPPEPSQEAADKQEPKHSGQFVIIGDSDFATNGYLDLQGNGDLFYSVVNWLAEEGDLLAIRAKASENQPLMLTLLQARLIFWVPVVFLPLLVLAVAAMVLLPRRRRV